MKADVIALFKKIYGYAPAAVTRAPGRIEFIGNHTDYNGGPVLGASIDRGVWVAVAPREDRVRRFYSGHTSEIVTLPERASGRQNGRASWVNYPLGVLWAMPVFKCKIPQGFDYVALSNLPSGAGLSSSAAIELASALAFLALTGRSVDRRTLVEIGKHAENHFVGVPCGILDQGVSGFGRVGRLVFIDCRGPSFDTVSLPPQARFWIFNTHTKHALVDGLYADRHRQCMDAARGLGVSLLADITAGDLARMQGSLAGDSFKRAQHVVEEIGRVRETVKALDNGDLQAVGRLLTASHRSSQFLFENSTLELDFLVDALVASKHVYGARLSGGGFGGAVMALTHSEFGEADAGKIADAYKAKFGVSPDVMQTRTDDGAVSL